VNCGRPALRLQAGRCPSCHLYWQRYRQERRPGAGQHRACATCGQPTGARARLRCPPCA